MQTDRRSLRKPEAIRASLMRKALADARQRAAVAAQLRITETDVLAIQHLALAGAMTPSRLAEEVRLTSGGMTALIRRLSRLGYLTREAHPEDRRSSLIRLSAMGEERAAELYAPLVRELDAATAALRPAEREVVAGYLARVADLGEAHADRLVESLERERPKLIPVPVPGLWS